MKHTTLELTMQFKPKHKKTLKKITKNLKRMNKLHAKNHKLLIENKGLLSEFLQTSLEVVE